MSDTHGTIVRLYPAGPNNNMFSLFVKHPREVNMTYWSHCKRAMGLGLHILYAGICCFIHAFFPFLFQTKASDLFKSGWCSDCSEPGYKCSCK
jgi:Family of unknown function (DUF6356)